MTDDNFLQVVTAELERDPKNLALREDLILLLLQTDDGVDGASEQLRAFEDAGGDESRAAVLRARVMAARLRNSPASTPTERPAPASEPGPSSSPPPEATVVTDHGDLRHQGRPGRWHAERPGVALADVAGLVDVKSHLDTTFLAPLRNPEMAAAFGQNPGGSLLMYGPPGCGKTFMARAIAGDLGASFIHVTLADLLSAYIGESEQAIQSVFRDARSASPCVIFFDEFDALGARRSSGGSESVRRMVTQLLEELDGVASANDGVYFLTATNRPWDIDPALRRPGRIDKTVLVLPPDREARAAILRAGLEGKPSDGVDIDLVAGQTEGFSGADLTAATKVALQDAMRRSMQSGSVQPVTTDALMAAVAGITPSTRSWFDQVASVLEFGVDDGTFDQLREYRVSRGMR